MTRATSDDAHPLGARQHEWDLIVFNVARRTSACSESVAWIATIPMHLVWHISRASRWRIARLAASARSRPSRKWQTRLDPSARRQYLPAPDGCAPPANPGHPRLLGLSGPRRRLAGLGGRIGQTRLWLQDRDSQARRMWADQDMPPSASWMSQQSPELHLPECEGVQ